MFSVRRFIKILFGFRWTRGVACGAVLRFFCAWGVLGGGVFTQAVHAVEPWREQLIRAFEAGQGGMEGSERQYLIKALSQQGVLPTDTRQAVLRWFPVRDVKISYEGIGTF